MFFSFYDLIVSWFVEDGGKQPSPLTGATTEGLPSGVLYRVRATYKYTREDVDEISFEIGDIIQVVEYDDPEEQVSDDKSQVFGIIQSWTETESYKNSENGRLYYLPQSS